MPASTHMQTAPDRAMSREVKLSLPHPLRQGEIAFLAIETGPLGRSELRLTTPAGKPLGMISPYGERGGAGDGSYTIPVPPDAFVDGQLTVRLTIAPPGQSPRAPTADEVKRVQIVIQSSTTPARNFHGST